MKLRLHRVLDLIFKQKFGVQIFDTIAAEHAPETQAEEPVGAAPEGDEDDDEFARTKRADIARLNSLKRTSPSRLGAEMSRIMARDTINRAKAANPKAAAVFTQAREEALNGHATSANGNH